MLDTNGRPMGFVHDITVILLRLGHLDLRYILFLLYLNHCGVLTNFQDVGLYLFFFFLSPSNQTSGFDFLSLIKSFHACRGRPCLW